MARLEEEGKMMRAEISELRDRLEEEEWEKRNLEAKMKRVEEKSAALRKGLERESDERRKKAKKVEERGGGGGGGSEGGRRNCVGERQVVRKRRVIVITDSNGKGATSDSIKNPIPRGEKESLDISVAVSFTTGDAACDVDRGSIDVRGARVIVDNLTNDIRGTRLRPALTPPELV